MTIRALLAGALLLQAGCVAHYKSASYGIDKQRDPVMQVENWRVSARLDPTVTMSPHDLKTRRRRLAAATHFSVEESGPYSLRVFLTTQGRVEERIENGVPVEVTSVELRFASGETRTILSRQEPPRKATTEQRPADGRGMPVATYSQCEFVFPLGEKLVFKADERVRTVITVRIPGLPQEVTVDTEFKPTFTDKRAWTAEVM